MRLVPSEDWKNIGRSRPNYSTFIVIEETGSSFWFSVSFRIPPGTHEEHQILARAQTNPQFPWDTTARQFIGTSVASVRTRRKLPKTVQANDENPGRGRSQLRTLRRLEADSA
jgi:hypothetical protein